MRTGFLKYPLLLCFACIAGCVLSVYAESPHPGYLWRLPAHSNGITRVVLFTLDGAQVLSAGDDGNVNFIRRSDGGLVTNITAHSGGAYALALSTDGSLVASGGQDGLLKIWRLADTALVRSFLAHTTHVACLAFSPDGSLLASGGGPDNQLKIWRVADAQLIRTISRAASPSRSPSMDSVAFSPDGRFVAGSGPEIWLLSDPTFVRTIGQTGDYDVKFSPDGTRIIAQQHYVVWVVNLTSGLVEWVPSPSFRPWSAFSPDGISLFSVSISGEAVWADFRRRIVITNYCSGVDPCPDVGRYSSVSFDPQMRAVALGTEAGEVILAELPLWISDIQHAGTDLTIQWQGGTGPFQLESVGDVTSGNWEDTGPPIVGSTVSTPMKASSTIYRVRDLAP